jgi:hypothetical protein
MAATFRDVPACVDPDACLLALLPVSVRMLVDLVDSVRLILPVRRDLRIQIAE